MSKINCGDTIEIISGNFKGKTGQVNGKKGFLLTVEGVGVFQKATKNGMQSKNRFIHSSNVKLIKKGVFLKREKKKLEN